MQKWWVQPLAITLALVLLFGPIVPAILFEQPAWMGLSLFFLILLLAG